MLFHHTKDRKNLIDKYFVDLLNLDNRMCRSLQNLISLSLRKARSFAFYIEQKYNFWSGGLIYMKFNFNMKFNYPHCCRIIRVIVILHNTRNYIFGIITQFWAQEPMMKDGKAFGFDNISVSKWKEDLVVRAPIKVGLTICKN